jgi:hypothetical protein
MPAKKLLCLVDALSPCRYRSAEHKQRSLKSYQVEAGFYRREACALRQVHTIVPLQHASLWNKEHTHGLLVMEDLRHWCRPAPPAAPGLDANAGDIQTVHRTGSIRAQERAPEGTAAVPSDSSQVAQSGSCYMRQTGTSAVELDSARPTRSAHQRMALSADEAVLTLQWLARFHAFFGCRAARGNAPSAAEVAEVAWSSGRPPPLLSCICKP